MVVVAACASISSATPWQPGSSAVAIEPVWRMSGAASERSATTASRCRIGRSPNHFRRVGERGCRPTCADAAVDQFHAAVVQIVGDPVAAGIVAQPRMELDRAVEQGQSDRDVQRAAAHVLSESLAVVLDDVDERFAHDNGAVAHVTPSTMLDSERIALATQGGRVRDFGRAGYLVVAAEVDD